jgi:hypothetical protein
MRNVDSSATSRIGYRPQEGELLVTFVGGKTYAYERVPKDVHDAFLEASSHGTFFNDRIKGHYRYRLVSAQTA